MQNYFADHDIQYIFFSQESIFFFKFQFVAVWLFMQNEAFLKFTTYRIEVWETYRDRVITSYQRDKIWKQRLSKGFMYHCDWTGSFVVSRKGKNNLMESWGGGEGRGRGGGGAGVNVVWVCEPVFRNLPHSYAWPLKKRTHSYILDRPKFWPIHILPFDFYTHLLLVVRQI